MLFTVGALALMSTATVLAEQLGSNARRERAARIAASRVEVLRAECRVATTGNERVGDVQSSWSAAPVGKAIRIIEAVSYRGARGARVDTLRAILPCG
jgi:hypothetical protein